MSLVPHIARFCRHGLAASYVLCGTPHRHSSNLRVEKEEGFAVMYMKRNPVNSCNKEFLQEITTTLLDIEKDLDINGLIITSELKNVFSTGLDLTEFYQKSFESVREFFTCFTENLLVLYGSRLATIAAINGHCVAGGALTATLCDYRIMTDGPYSIGFVLAQRGLVMPHWLCNIVRNTIGARETERAVQLGLAYKPQDALRIGMVDELVDDQDRLLDCARKEMAHWLTIPSGTRMACKRVVRGPMLAELRQGMEENVESAARSAVSEAAQRSIEEFMTRKKN